MENESIFTFTGNPFVDAGAYAATAWFGKEKPEEVTRKDVLDGIDGIADLYLQDKWKRTIHGAIFPNITYVNYSQKKGEKISLKDKLRYFFKELIQKDEMIGEGNDCISCGRRKAVKISNKNIYKNIVPLTGSGKLANFFSYLTGGADYCASCLLAVQFLPLALEGCGDKNLFIHSTSNDVMIARSYEITEFIKRDFLKNPGDVSGLYKRGFSNPVNALFRVAEDIIFCLEDIEPEGPVSIRMYHISNNNQSPGLAFYDLPSRIFTFLLIVKNRGEFSNWHSVSQRGYRKLTSEKTEEEKEKIFRSHNNRVYQNLIQHKSILPFFYNTSERRSYGGWNLLMIYAEEVLNMDKKRLEWIKDLADKLTEIIRIENDAKFLQKIEFSRNYYSFSTNLIKAMKKWLSMNKPEPLLKVDDYFENIFPEGDMGWKLVQDLILIRLYENLHEWLLSQSEVLEEVTEEENEIELTEVLS